MSVSGESGPAFPEQPETALKAAAAKLSFTPSSCVKMRDRI